MNWTAVMESALRQLWADPNLSCAKIAVQIGEGVTRNAVIFKAKLMNLGSKLSNDPHTTRSPKVKKQTPPRRSSPYMQPELFVPRATDIIPFNLTILEVRDNECKFIPGDDRLCCGHPVKEGKPYCPAHCAIVYVPPRERTERQTEADEKRRYYAMQRSPAKVGEAA